MAHVQHHQANHTLVQSPGVLKLEPAPLKRRALARHGSLQPQENDDDGDEDGDGDETGQSDATVDSEKEWSDRPRRLSDRCQVKKAVRDDSKQLHHPHEQHRSVTLLPELELVCSLTRRIRAKLAREAFTQQELEDDEDAGDDYDVSSLAELFCERAKALLRYAKFDASVHIPLALLETLDPQLVERESRLFVSLDGLAAVQQAMDDAQAAVARDPRTHDAYLVAAEAARSLGDVHEALALAQCAQRQTPQRKQVHTLLRQLLHDTDATRLEIVTPFLCKAPPSMDDQDKDQQNEDQDDDEEDDDHVSAELTRRFRCMEALDSSPVLRRLEPMMHEALHHQCASNDEALALTAATNETVAFLRVLLEGDASETTSRAIGIEANVLRDTARQLQDARRLVESPYLRRWLVRTLAPAVMASLPSIQNTIMLASAAPSSRSALLRDVLLTLARLLLALGSLQRCTNVPFALATTKTAYDLTRQLAGDDARFKRMEMAGKDAYALALLDLAEESGEALVLHQETLDAAIKLGDRDRELRSRHALGRTLFHVREFETARDEFQLLLQQSEAVGDCAMACLALYLLGECQVAVGDLDEAMRLFERALVVCHQTAHCQGAWRRASIQRAIDFYACMLRPARRPALRRSSLSKPRKATLVVPTPSTLVEQDSEYWAWEDESAEEPKARRGAVWMTSTTPVWLEGTKPETTDDVPTPRRTLAQTLIGGFAGGQLETSEELAQEEKEEMERTLAEPVGPLTTHGVTLTGWLIGQCSTSPTRPECCKPVE